MKKYIALAIVLIASCFVLSVNAAEVPPVTVTLDGEIVDCAYYGQQATIVDGRTLVPLRAIFESLGASVEWDPVNYIVTSTLDTTTISLKIGENKLYRNGEVIELDVPAMLMNDRTMLPVRAVSEAFGIKVEWIDETRTVVLLSDSYKRGIRSDDTYYGEWLGFNYILPDGYVFSSERKLFEEMGVVSIAEDDVDFKALPYVYEFEISDKNGNMLSVACEKNASRTDTLEYLENAVRVYEMSGIDAEISDIHETSYGFAVDVSACYLGVDFNQRIAVYEKEKRLVSIIFTYTDTSALTMLESGFEAYTAPSEKPVIKEDTVDGKSETGNAAVPYSKKLHAYGELYLGMTKGEAKRAVKGRQLEKNDGKTLNVFDENGIYDDEDESITRDAECDFISLTFDDGLLKHVYVSTEYTTLEKTSETLKNVADYYGEPEYVFETEEDFYDAYFWTDGNICADCTIVFEKNKGYSCILEIYYA